MRRFGSGTASRMSLDWQNPILSFGGCSRSGSVSTVSAPLVLPDLFTSFCSVQFSLLKFHFGCHFMLFFVCYPFEFLTCYAL